MEKANSSKIFMEMIDGKIVGHCHGNSTDIGLILCRATYDLLNEDPEMLRLMEKGMRKVFRMKRIDAIARWIYTHVGYAFMAVFMLVLLGCCIVI